MSYWDKYKSSHEPKEHWSLRKKFLETHKDSFDEDRLLCLAQVFYNVEFLGCRYPDAVMKQIEELSQGIADDHREQKKSKLQRTFVQASEAAESKVCRTGIKRKHEDGDSSVPNRPQGGQSIHDVLRNRYEPPPQVTASGLDLHSIESYLSRDPPVSQLILVRMKNESALTFEYLQRSTKFSQMNMDFAFTKIQENQFEAALKLGIPDGSVAFVLIRTNTDEFYIVHPIHGLKYSVHDSFSPLHKVYCLINQENIWMNIQEEEIVKRTRFDVRKSQDWLPDFRTIRP
ncbi:uncharacterized protein LOC103512925 [Diaphorina citri]|uniref:Uncharacterized protein LOC103512925 n=1 Tax=Diaphorina citri TaxID=121845 RepID=A0A1S3D783_DIACI|nr:uncharacterized protein LOC103512925 [Diaphorina citri]